MGWESQVHRFDAVDSTMHVARRMAIAGAQRVPAPEGTAVVAHSQTAGRGRRGRIWVAPPGTGLLLTVVLRPNHPPAALGSLALVAGASVLDAVCGLLAACGCTPQVRPRLKWPNDVLVGERKLAGILLEAEDLLSVRPYVLVGMGINLAARAACGTLPSEVAQRYVGVADLGVKLSPAELHAQLLPRVLAALQQHYVSWQSGGLDAALRVWRQADALLGQLVRIRAPGGIIEGRARGLAADGRLQVDTPEGMAHVLAGEVERLEAS